jgi:cell division protein FtsX
MRLVGASNWFIRAPYIFSSLIYTLFGLVLTIAVFYPFLSILQPYLETFFSGYSFNIISYFQTHFWRLFLIEFLGAGAINVFASWVAVRKYSKV